MGTEKAAAIRGLEKKRESMFAQSDQERRRLQSETAAYRLKETGDKFASSSNASEVALQQATVGLVSKEEFARRRKELEGGETSTASGCAAEAAASSAEPEEKKRKKKKAKVGGSLSFALDEVCELARSTR